MKRVVVLGSTGSIGTQALDVIAQHENRLKVVGLAARRNGELLREQAALHGVSRLALFEGAGHGDLPSGMQSLVDLVVADDVDIVLVAVAGVIGLEPTIAAIKAGKDIALASKEVLVAAGEPVMKLVRSHGVTMTPVDSEHSAIFQCLQGYRADQIESLILTASGGPFKGRKGKDLENVTVDQALAHPTWRMGGKITVDSATLMNKALETIEARWLFDVPISSVQAVIHPQSVIHSMVKFKDGSVLGQMGWPDMRLPIAYALLYPDRVHNSIPPWNPLDSPALTFEPIDEVTFDALRIARLAVEKGGTTPAAMNAANEEAVSAFLRDEIPFLQITRIVKTIIDAHESVDPNLEAILFADEQARRFTRTLIEGCSR